MTQVQNTRSVTIKDKIYNTDLDTGRTTVVRNPMYESMVKSVKRKGAKIGRNEPCPGGSGKKFKHCHGKLT